MIQLLVPAAIGVFGLTATYGVYKGIMNELDKNEGRGVKEGEPVGVMEGFEYGMKIPFSVFKPAFTKALNIDRKKLS